MPQGNPKPGERYLHFKKKLYQIITIAEHSETQEALVIYQALYGDFKNYAMPLDMFLSTVDAEKYPDAEQRYRFQFLPDSAALAAGTPASDTPVAGVPADATPADTPAASIPVDTTPTDTPAVGIPADGISADALTGIPAGAPAMDIPANGSKALLSPEEKLMAFFDAETMDEKYRLLLDMCNDITDRMINNMAVALDVVIDEGPLERRYEELKTCVRTFRKYETSRLR